MATLPRVAAWHKGEHDIARQTASADVRGSQPAPGACDTTLDERVSRRGQRSFARDSLQWSVRGICDATDNLEPGELAPAPGDAVLSTVKRLPRTRGASDGRI